jgi:hypothetical protein
LSEKVTGVTPFDGTKKKESAGRREGGWTGERERKQDSFDKKGNATRPGNKAQVTKL